MSAPSSPWRTSASSRLGRQRPSFTPGTKLSTRVIEQSMALDLIKASGMPDGQLRSCPAHQALLREFRSSFLVAMHTVGGQPESALQRRRPTERR